MERLLKNGILVGLFLLIIFSSILFASIDKIPELVVNGVTEEIAKPDLNIGSYLNGTYQTQYESWFSSHFPERSYLLRTYSDLIYSVFKKSPNKEVVIGNQGQLLEKSYIDAYLGLGERAESNELETLAEDLKYIQDACQKEGKYFTVVITPSKAAYHPEYIPSKYFRMAKSMNAEYSDFIQQLQGHGVDYFDTYSYLKEIEDQISIPVFPKTGTHWNAVVGAKVASGLVDYFNVKGGYTLPKMELGEIQTGTKPFDATDQDIYRIMNITNGDKDALYYKADTWIDEPLGEKKSLFWEGGSFSWQIINRFEENELFNNMDFIFYEQMIRQYRGSLCRDINLSNDNIEAYIRKALVNKDIIVLEVNQENIANMGYGFPHRLREYIEKNGFPEPPLPTHYDTNEKAEIQRTGGEIETICKMDGFYDEGSIDGVNQCWMEKDGYITLAAHGIRQSGLRLLVNVPLDYLNKESKQAKSLKVMVDERLVGEFILMKNGLTEIVIPPDVIGETDEDCYKIHLQMNTTFQMKNHEDSEDDRELSIGLVSIGAVAESLSLQGIQGIQDQTDIRAMTQFIPHDESTKLFDHVVGIYGEESQGQAYYHWLGKNGYMVLEDQRISSQGLELDGAVFMEYLNVKNPGAKTLSVYINNKKAAVKEFTQSGQFKLFIPKTEFETNSEDRYAIYLDMNCTFNLFKDLGIDQDKDLSMQLMYLGAPQVSNES